jgi:hypothetical protein
LSVGTVVIGVHDRYPENADFVVMADTEDNRFCVIDTSD